MEAERKPHERTSPETERESLEFRWKLGYGDGDDIRGFRSVQDPDRIRIAREVTVAVYVLHAGPMCCLSCGPAPDSSQERSSSRPRLYTSKNAGPSPVDTRPLRKTSMSDSGRARL